MLKSQKTYLEKCDTLKKILAEVEIPEETSKDIEGIRQVLTDAELVVPVVGSFSAGKSTLINSFIDDAVLPVAITPETSIATELRYAPIPRLEAVAADGRGTAIADASMDELKKCVADYQYARLYLKNGKLAEISPLVLVDMPGYDSPVDLHNRAILTYIRRGCHFIVLTSVEDGNITRSMVRQLEDFLEFGRSFTSFLSKANLRSPDQVKEVAEYVDDQLRDMLDVDVNTIPVGDQGGEELTRILKEINPEALFARTYLPPLKSLCYDIVNMLNTRIGALKRDKGANEEAVAALGEQRDRIARKTETMVANAEERYATPAVNGIVRAVSRALSEETEDLVALAQRGDSDGVSHQISETVRHAMLQAIRKELTCIQTEIVEGLSEELQEIRNVLGNYSLGENALDRVLGTDFVTLSTDIQGEGIEDKVETDGKAITTLALAIVAIVTDVVTPAIEAVVVLLPTLLGPWFRKLHEDNQSARIREHLLAKVFPNVKKRICDKIPSVMKQQIASMIGSIHQAVDGIVEKRLTEIREEECRKQEQLAKVEDMLASFTGTRDTIIDLVNELLS